MDAPAPPRPASAGEPLTIRPPPGEWPALLAAAWGADPAAIARRERFRSQLGLPDGPIIMSGHQPEFWHPGILAKYLAADAAAARLGARAAWLVVDQGRPVSVEVRYPARADGRLVARSLVLTRDVHPPLPADAAAPFVREGLARILGAMDERRAEPDLARRTAGALGALIAPLVRAPAPTLFATELSRTDLFSDLARRMASDPEACARAYNEAAAAHPGAGLRALIADEVQDRWELPLWRLAPGAPRERVYAEMLPDTPPDQLAPRALFTTALLRLAGCVLFIHGTGGGGADEVHEGYDAAMEDWLGRWLGIPPASLAPRAVVTATRTLPLEAGPTVTPSEAATAAWRAHSARHDPGLLGDGPAAARKRGLVAAIAASPDRRARESLYREMHAGLEAYRAARGRDLGSLAESAAEASARLADTAILTDRTWPFPLYPPGAIARLRDEIEAEFARGARS